MSDPRDRTADDHYVVLGIDQREHTIVARCSCGAQQDLGANPTPAQAWRAEQQHLTAAARKAAHWTRVFYPEPEP